MCGIIGFNWEDKPFLKKALKEITHRGPDDFGAYIDKNVSLGHRRLSIVDLSKAGRQPMSNEDGTIWIIFNGEIYNHNELREKLEKKYSFKSKTDTEVLIYLYEEHGPNFLHLLHGMFAFCIYDSRKGIFFLARDRVGIKPLYYLSHKNKFIFASEIKAILAEKSVQRTVNIQALSSYLTFRANTLEETFFNGVKKLLPGHYLIYDLKKKAYTLKKYWDISTKISKKSEKYYSNQLISLLDDSVRNRLMADVPYGAYLSGGIDSGTIVALMKQHSPSTPRTFSVGFSEEKDSETKMAKVLSEKIGTEHRELILEKSSIKFLPEIVYHSDEPLADPTLIPTYLLSRFAKKHATVILTGEGSDEIFAGYPQYKFMKMNLLANRAKVFPGNLRAQIIKLTPRSILNAFFKYSSSLGDEGIARFEDFAKSKAFEDQYLNIVSIFNQKEQKMLLNKGVEFKGHYKKYFQNNDVVTGCQLLDFKNSMVEDLLMKLDKTTMAFGVEGRVPFLDHRVVELAFSMPSNFKLRGLSKDKNILRNSVKSLVPHETSSRKKRHFFVPIDSWLKDDLSSIKQDFLSRDYVRKQKIFSPDYILKIEKGFNRSPLYYSRQLWSLLTFQMWYKRYFENEKINI